jgi:hypothetical protein
VAENTTELRRPGHQIFNPAANLPDLLLLLLQRLF